MERLCCSSCEGSNRGRPTRCRGVCFRIGSDEGNDLVLKDRDVQPQQLEISFAEDRFVLKSLSSEGPVFLNGEPFEESTLQKGDILSVGESMFRYVDPGETLSQEDLWRPVGGKQTAAAGKKAPLRRISFLMVLAFFAVGAVLLILFTQGNQEDQTQPRASDKLADLEKPVDREELKVQYENGKDLLAARRWDEAILVFEGIRKQMPNFMDVENLYQEALWESEYVDILNQGKGLVLENELVDAKDQMEQVPKKSVYYREAERLTREIEDMILEQRLQAATAALARQDWSFAKREAEAILAKYPNNKDARRIVLEARMLQRQALGQGVGRAYGLVPQASCCAGAGRLWPSHRNRAPLPQRPRSRCVPAPRRGHQAGTFRMRSSSTARARRRRPSPHWRRSRTGRKATRRGGSSKTCNLPRPTSSRREPFSRRDVSQRHWKSGSDSSKETGTLSAIRRGAPISFRLPLPLRRSITTGAGGNSTGETRSGRPCSGKWERRSTRRTRICDEDSVNSTRWRGSSTVKDIPFRRSTSKRRSRSGAKS